MRAIFSLVFGINFALVIVEANWKLVWSEEFTENELNGWFTSQTNSICINSKCRNYTKANVESLSGALVITDPQNDYTNRTYIDYQRGTSGEFKYGKYVIRAAQPKGNNIGTDIALFQRGKDMDKWSTFYIIRYKQQPFIEQQIEHDWEGPKQDTPTEANLNDFHIYSMEVNETDMIWYFDDQETFRTNVTDLMDPNESFQMNINFVVGGHRFGEQEVNEKPFEETDCPAFIIDYIRYYQWTDEELNSTITESDTSMSRDQICAIIKNLNNTLN